jgi:hypothetical protein
MWAVPAIFFAPVVYAMLIRWLGEPDDSRRRTPRSIAPRTRPHQSQPPAAAPRLAFAAGLTPGQPRGRHDQPATQRKGCGSDSPR